MSSDQYREKLDRVARTLLRYKRGEDRYARMAREVFGRRLGGTQEEILRAVANNRRVLIVSGNGVGKSYAVALLILGYLYSNPDSIAMLTSGSYSMLTDTTWKPMKTVFKEAKERSGVPGDTLDNPPRLETRMSDEWYFKAVSPTHPDSLEGRHASDILVVIEEADKPDITEDHFESAGTSITDANDRMVAVANPPTDESNVVYKKMQSDRWHVVQFDSFDSHNVLCDAGKIDAEPIPGLVDLPTVAEDYEAWNGVPWPETPDSWEGTTEYIEAVQRGEIPREKLIEMLRPGIETARKKRDGLDSRWYRRRLGVMPPDDSRVPRPWTVADVEAAEDRWEDAAARATSHRSAMAVDVARGGGDRTAVAQTRDNVVEIVSTSTRTDHNQNEERIATVVEDAPLNGPLAIDAVGEGSGVADRLVKRLPHNVVRFNAGSTAEADDDYRYARDEALQMLGDFLRDGGAVEPDSDLADELKSHARECSFEEVTLQSATVFRATSKDEIKDALGKSPDLVDAASMAAWAEGDFGLATSGIGVWGSEY